MRIMWHGVPPWWPSGYGTQAAVWCKRLMEAGHEVIFSAHAGADLCSEMEWQGMHVLPSTPHPIALPLVLADRLQRVNPDVTITLCDIRDFPNAMLFRDRKVISFIPGDCSTLSAGDAQFLQDSGARPIAMSRHMQKVLDDAGYEAPYVPHALDTTVWRPPEDRGAIRQEMQLHPETFAVGINARNIDALRKFLPEQLSAFAKFAKRNKDVSLSVHTMGMDRTGVDVAAVCRSVGLKFPQVRFPDQPTMYLEMFPQDAMIKWYQSQDVVLNCSRGEGFGLAAIEAQACGTPVILADNTTGPELVGPGWLVRCQEHWNGTHEAWQATPLVGDIIDRLVKASNVSDVAGKRAAARRFGQGFDVESVWPLFEKALAELTE